MTFSHLGLSDKVLAAVASAGYTNPTPIQEQAIPHVLARRDVLGIAQTGTGKTAAFVLPILQQLPGLPVRPKGWPNKVICLGPDGPTCKNQPGGYK